MKMFERFKRLRKGIGHAYLECSGCGRDIEKGDYFVAMGKLRSFWREHMGRLDALLRQETDKIYCKSCFEEKYKEK